MTQPYEVLTTYPLEQIFTLLTGNDRKCVMPKKEPTVSCQPCNGDEMEWIILKIKIYILFPFRYAALFELQGPESS